MEFSLASLPHPPYPPMLAESVVSLDTIDTMEFHQLVALCNAPREKRSRPYVIALDGNIGAGKSTLLAKLKRVVDPKRVVVILEPVDAWEKLTDDTDEKNILEKFYTYPANYAFMFQTVVLHSLMAAMDRAVAQHPDCEVIVCERSVASSRHVFMQMLRDQGKILPFECKVYESFFTESVVERYYPDKVVYLDVPPKVCLERLLQRSRKGEDDIPLTYLEQLDATYRAWLAVFDQRGQI